MVVKTISAAKAQLSALIELVCNGEEVIIGRAGRPVAVLTRYSPCQRRRTPGALKGKISIAADFDDLPADIAEAFGAVAEGSVAYGDTEGKKTS
jgi:prevent-host-death family protein